jgi:hypothetical protein
MRLSRTLARPASQLPPRQPKPNEVVYHHQLAAERDDVTRTFATVEQTLTLQTRMIEALEKAQREADRRHVALDLALAMHRAEVEHNRLTNRVKRVLFRRIF